MNQQRRIIPMNVPGYPEQYSPSPFAPGMPPRYPYQPMQYPVGQQQLSGRTRWILWHIALKHWCNYTDPHICINIFRRRGIQFVQQNLQPLQPKMANPTQSRQMQMANTSMMMPNQPTIVRKRTNPDAATINAQQVKKKRALDRNMPEKLDTLVPESRLYTELQEFERRLDATIIRKKMEITESYSKPMKVKRTLRVFVSNTSSNQQPVQGEGDNELEYGDGSNIPAWTLRIEGRLLDAPNAPKNTRPNHKFSRFFKAIIVELDRDPELYPEGNLIEWNKIPDSEEVDGFEIKRKGDVNLKAKIYLNIDQQPARYKLSPELSEILDLKEETKSGIIMTLWQYVKHNNLQDAEDKRIINNDARLAEVFKVPRMAFPQIPELINKHLLPIDPISIDYTIRVDKEYHQSRYAYDIEVEVEDPNKARLAAIATTNMTNQKEIQNLDDKIVQCVQSINNSKTKRDFLLNFASSPVEFINKWIASQSLNLEEQRRSEFYKQTWVNEAIFHYTTAQAQRKMHESMSTGGGANKIEQRQLMNK
ncbi:18231_t:CDS:10 [Acaulospora morrowiae]|uniref:18231_t:CDS:1 n=1 Tax=Acaulospora morrowiae TaxID=94023 RepID=A0A9N9F947_9GLOM|nr:18231_t:CDS:10 [Acaulospora morrowiae]